MKEKPSIFPVGDEKHEVFYENPLNLDASSYTFPEEEGCTGFPSTKKLIEDTTEVVEKNGISYFVLKDRTYGMIDPTFEVSEKVKNLDMCKNPGYTNVFHISWDGGLSDEGLICGKHADAIMKETKGWKLVDSTRGYMTASDSNCVSRQAVHVDLHIFGIKIRVKFQIVRGAVFPMMVGQKIMRNLGIDTMNSIQCMALKDRTEHMCQYSSMPAIDCVLFEDRVVSIDTVHGSTHKTSREQCLLTMSQDPDFSGKFINRDHKKVE